MAEKTEEEKLAFKAKMEAAKKAKAETKKQVVAPITKVETPDVKTEQTKRENDCILSGNIFEGNYFGGENV